MRAFNFNSCSVKDVIAIKKEHKAKANNENANNKYLSLLEDTKTAIDNISECIDNESSLNDKMALARQGNVSFADDILGMSPIGNNKSRYRAFLASDNTNIIEIRIGNHYETEKAALDKSNNKSQFLLQVVLITEPPQPEANNAIKNTTKIGNLHVLTKKLVSSDFSAEDLKNALMGIRDCLISPTRSFEQEINNQKTNENIKMNKKQTIRLNESQFNNLVSKIVKESVKRVLREHEDDWFDESDEGYIGRTSAFYGYYDDDSIYEPDYWTYSTDPNDEEFAGEVYQLNDEGKSELNYWIRCRRFNEYQRKNAFNPRNESPEEEWNKLTNKYYSRRIK